MDKKTERFIINILRQGTLKYEGRNQILQEASKKIWEGEYYKGGKKKGRKKYKTYWRCAKCKKWFREEGLVEVDHIDEVGPYKGDLHDYAKRLYNFIGNAQVLCIKDHKAKTSANASVRYKRKKRK